MSSIRRLRSLLAIASLALSVTALLGLLAAVGISTVMRGVAGTSFSGSVEVSGYLMVAVSSLGIPYCAHTGGFLKVEVLSERLGGIAKSLAAKLGHALALTFFVLLSKFSFDMALNSLEREIESTGPLEFPLFVPQGVMLLGFVLASVYFLFGLLLLLFDKRLSDGESIDLIDEVTTGSTSPTSAG